MLNGHWVLKDFLLTREYRGPGRYKDGSTPMVRISNKLAEWGRPALARERLPFVVVHGEPNASLISLVRHPAEFLADPTLMLNIGYYWVKQILPALKRMFEKGPPALKAGEDSSDDAANACIDELMKALDETIPEPERALDKPFLMPIEDVFSITGRGTVVTGRVEQGIVHTGDEIEIVGSRTRRRRW